MIIQPARHEDRWGGRRARIIAGALGLVFAVIVGRSAQVAFAGSGDTGLASNTGEVVRRADIVDHNGDLLATSLPAWSLSADPKAIWDAKEVAEGLATVLPGVDVKDLSAKLSDKSKRFVWIQRGLSPQKRQQIFELGLEGLRFEEEMRRVYPGGKLAGHLLGFTNVDGKGVEGLERVFQDRLAKGGEPLQLTIDASVQFALEAELENASKEFDMEGAAGVVVEASTGAVRAIASWPAIDPNLPATRTEKAKPDRSLNSVYELGSVFKPLTVAAALDAGVLSPSDTFDVSQPLRIGVVNVRDAHAMEHPQSFTAGDVLAYSSNIGTVQIAKRLGAETQKSFLESVGLMGRVTTDGPQPAAPLLPAANWDALTAATVSYGHGIAVSPLAFAMTYLPFATGGEWLKPTFLEPIDPAKIERKRVMKPETAKTVLDMMRRTVLIGTGKLAEAPGFQVAGKTGTAEKIGANGYDPDRNITSFAAVFPASRPQFVVLVVLDDAKPKIGDARTAAYTSAAIAGRLIARAAPMLDVAPILDPPVAEARPDLKPELRPVSDSRSL
jgi:cell division protein FtsI (penicillin-binding protein 3)